MYHRYYPPFTGEEALLLKGEGLEVMANGKPAIPAQVYLILSLFSLSCMKPSG